MPDPPQAAITTILFTDLVDSTELIQSLGDERAQRIFQAHHETLSSLLAAHRGAELQWLGDGLMAAFASAADAVRCAIAMQRATRQPLLGQQLAMRAGLNVGEILRQATGSGHFGTPVVVASRLCDRGHAGQILASSLVAGLLAGRQAFRFQQLGLAELKGIHAPVGVAEVLYESAPTPFVTKTPFVGRRLELGRLEHALDRAVAGAGGLVMLVGEPGIGKTRTLEEFTAHARSRGVWSLWGRCYEGEGARPYAPFAEALDAHLARASPEELAKDLGPYGAALDTVAPRLRERVPDLGVLPRLEPSEAQTRLFDALAQFLLATARRVPVVLILDDLHWADGSTVALLRYLARFARRGRLLLLGAYRDVELDRRHPLAEALAVLKREVEYERVLLKGLPQKQVAELLEALSAEGVRPTFAEAMSEETEGNPFFILEILMHLLEEGRLHHTEGRWASDLSIEELGIPEGVRQVIGRRLSRLSGEANRLLRVASGCDASFSFEVASRVAELDEERALDALDAALEAQILRPGGDVSTYAFTHALIRHTLYGEMNPSRQVRLHRRIAERMEQVYGGRTDHAGEIARQYHRSAAIPGAERGVGHCVAAADHAERAAAHREVASAMHMALDLLPDRDSKRGRVLARLGLALARSHLPEEASAAARAAAELIAAVEGSAAAAEYLAETTEVSHFAGLIPCAWQLAGEGLRYTRGARDLTWARLALYDLDRREAEDSTVPGIAMESPRRWELSRVLRDHWQEDTGPRPGKETRSVIFSSREDLLAHAGERAQLVVRIGDYRSALALFRGHAEATVERGQVVRAAANLAHVARLECALGNLAASEQALARATELLDRVTSSQFTMGDITEVAAVHALTRGEGFEALIPAGEAMVDQPMPEIHAELAHIRAAIAVFYAHADRSEDALRALESILSAIERGPGWADAYPRVVHFATETLWALGRRDFAPILERNLREKTLKPDFRYPQTDARLSLARLCALEGRCDEATDWFAKARTVLDEQGALPLRALADYDEALMHLRRGDPADRPRAASLLDLALHQFREIGMPGWVRRSEALVEKLS